MNEEPPVPQPVPEIPRGRLWGCLSIPPALTVLANGLIAIVGRTGDAASATFLVPVIVFFVIIAFTLPFNEAVGKRYRGSSLVFLTLTFLFGQIIVCLALWFGSCVLFFPAPNFH